MNITLHKYKLTPERVREQLLPFFKGASAVLDLTTVVDSETVARLADEAGCVYINACLEVFAEDEDLSEAQRHKRFREIRGQFKNTIVLEIGMNPGLISCLCQRAMRDSGFAAQDIDWVHVTEFDTHVLKPERKDHGAFYNTWSPFGLWEEGVKKAEMAWYGPAPEGWVKDTHLIVAKEQCGVEMCLQSVTPKWTSQTSWEFGPYWGFIVTHGKRSVSFFSLSLFALSSFLSRIAFASLKERLRQSVTDLVSMSRRHLFTTHAQTPQTVS